MGKALRREMFEDANKSRAEHGEALRHEICEDTNKLRAELEEALRDKFGLTTLVQEMKQLRQDLDRQQDCGTQMEQLREDVHASRGLKTSPTHCFSFDLSR